MNLKAEKRIIVFVGHFGSGKTECAVNYGLKLNSEGFKTSIIDLDIANPYFRSREKKKYMTELGIKCYSNMYDEDITDEIPAIDPGIRMPLENKEYHAVVDAGGDGMGAKILVQFRKYFIGEDCELWAVLNANRPGTNSVDGALKHFSEIEAACGVKIKGIVNNTHMIRETRPEDIIKGYRLGKELSEKTGLPLKFNTCVEYLLEDLKKETEAQGISDMEIFPINLEMRESWLDKKVYHTKITFK